MKKILVKNGAITQAGEQAKQATIPILSPGSNSNNNNKDCVTDSKQRV